MAETLDEIPNFPKSCDREAGIAIRSLTAGQLRNLFHFAATVLPDGHPLKLRIRAIADDINQSKESIVGQALDPEVKDTAIAVWRAIEDQKESAGREKTRIIEEYRYTRSATMDQFLSRGAIAEGDLADLKKEFKEADGHNPDLCAWVYINESPVPTGPGSLLFRELANRGAWAVAQVGGNDGWEHWLDVLVGYLLTNDRDGEYLQKFRVGRVEPPVGPPGTVHPGVIVHGENYEILRVFKASEQFVPGSPVPAERSKRAMWQLRRA